MSDFAEGLISAIAGGVHGGAEATGQIYEDERKNAARIETETQLAQAQAEIQLQKQKQLTVFAESQRREGKKADFEEEGKNLTETVRRAGLIEAGKTDAEKAKWNDPEYRKAQALKEGITNPDHVAGLRAEQTKTARLTNDATEKNAGYTEGLRAAEANLSSASPGTAEYAKAEKDVAAYRKALDVGRPGHDDPLSSKVSAAKAILADFDSTDEQKLTARDFLASNLKSGVQKLPSGSPKISTYEEYQALPKGTTYIAPDGQTRTKK